MTRLDKRKSTLQFSTSDTIFDQGTNREISVVAHPFYAELRLKGQRTSYNVSWSAIYGIAVKNAVREARQK